MRYLICVGASIAFFAVSTVAFASGLTERDYGYLNSAHNIDRDSLILKGLSPKEQARLHALINDTKTSGNAATRTQDVSDALAKFAEHQRWEQDNPGKLWDAPKR